jgi:hypothetical protein
LRAALFTDSVITASSTIWSAIPSRVGPPIAFLALAMLARLHGNPDDQTKDHHQAHAADKTY